MKISIFYTNKCNINCEHCFLGNKGNYHRMSNHMLNDILNQCKQIGINTISFTGGEALLYWENINNVLRTVDLEGVKITFSTNAYWAVNSNKSDKFCEQLKEQGVSQLEVSCDEYHAKYIPFNNVINLIQSAKKFCIDIKIIMSVSNKLSYLGLYYKLLKYVTSKTIILQNVAQFGNAKDNNIDSFLENNKFQNVKCEQVMNPCITYTGDVYACCGPCVSLGTDNVLYISNLSNNDLASIIEQMKTNRTIISIYEQGPYCLKKDKRNNYCSSLCDFCMENY